MGIAKVGLIETGGAEAAGLLSEVAAVGAEQFAVVPGVGGLAGPGQGQLPDVGDERVAGVA
ncbi:hypothetical protein ADL26_19595, partial [Thermoactinomyces vulgaris]